MTNYPTRDPAHSLAPLGYGLGALCILAFAALLHHPTGHGREAGDVLASIRSQTTMDQLVHATMATTFSALTAIMSLFALRLGAKRFLVVLGLVVFWCAFIMIVLAALTDGFIVPAIASLCSIKSSPACVAEALPLLRLSGLQVEFLTRFSFVGIAVAVLAWSGALLSTRGIPRWAGFVGVACGGAQLMTLLLASERLRPSSLLLIFAAQVVWYLLAALLMVRGTGPFADGESVKLPPITTDIKVNSLPEKPV